MDSKHDDVMTWKTFRNTDPLCGESAGHFDEGPLMRNVDVYIVFGLNKLLTKHSSYLRHETTQGSCDIIVMKPWEYSAEVIN